jgi:hypothetical protein
MFERLAVMESHIQMYGVDRTFLNLCNYDNVLGNALGIHLPSAEAFDAVGNPSSPESIACLEGISEYWVKLKNFVKKLWEKFKNWVARMVTMVQNWFNSSSDTYARVRKMLEAAKAKGGKISAQEKGKKEVADPAYLKELDALINNASKLAAGIRVSGVAVEETSDSQVKQADKGFTEAKTKLKNAKAKLASRTVQLNKLNVATCDGLMATWMNTLKIVTNIKNAIDMIDGDGAKGVKDLLQDLDDATKNNNAKVKKVKNFSKFLNIVRTFLTYVLTYAQYEINTIRKVVVAFCQAVVGSELGEKTDELREKARDAASARAKK